MIESVLESHGPCESLERSIVQIGLETRPSYANRLCRWGQAKNSLVERAQEIATRDVFDVKVQLQLEDALADAETAAFLRPEIMAECRSMYECAAARLVAAAIRGTPHVIKNALEIDGFIHAEQLQDAVDLRRIAAEMRTHVRENLVKLYHKHGAKLRLESIKVANENVRISTTRVYVRQRSSITSLYPF